MLDLILAVPAATAPSARSSLDFVFGDRPAFPPGVSALEDLALAAHSFMLGSETARDKQRCPCGSGRRLHFGTPRKYQLQLGVTF